MTTLYTRRAIQRSKAESGANDQNQSTVCLDQKHNKYKEKLTAAKKTIASLQQELSEARATIAALSETPPKAQQNMCIQTDPDAATEQLKLDLDKKTQEVVSLKLKFKHMMSNIQMFTSSIAQHVPVLDCESDQPSTSYQNETPVSALVTSTDLNVTDSSAGARPGVSSEVISQSNAPMSCAHVETCASSVLDQASTVTASVPKGKKTQENVQHESSKPPANESLDLIENDYRSSSVITVLSLGKDNVYNDIVSPNASHVNTLAQTTVNNPGLKAEEKIQDNTLSVKGNDSQSCCGSNDTNTAIKSKSTPIRKKSRSRSRSQSVVNDTDSKVPKHRDSAANEHTEQQSASSEIHSGSTLLAPESLSSSHNAPRFAPETDFVEQQIASIKSTDSSLVTGEDSDNHTRQESEISHESLNPATNVESSKPKPHPMQTTQLEIDPTNPEISDKDAKSKSNCSSVMSQELKITKHLQRVISIINNDRTGATKEYQSETVVQSSQGMIKNSSVGEKRSVPFEDAKVAIKEAFKDDSYKENSVHSRSQGQSSNVGKTDTRLQQSSLCSEDKIEDSLLVRRNSRKRRISSEKSEPDNKKPKTSDQVNTGTEELKSSSSEHKVIQKSKPEKKVKGKDKRVYEKHKYKVKKPKPNDASTEDKLDETVAIMERVALYCQDYRDKNFRKKQLCISPRRPRSDPEVTESVKRYTTLAKGACVRSRISLQDYKQKCKAVQRMKDSGEYMLQLEDAMSEAALLSPVDIASIDKAANPPNETDESTTTKKQDNKEMKASKRLDFSAIERGLASFATKIAGGVKPGRVELKGIVAKSGIQDKESGDQKPISTSEAELKDLVKEKDEDLRVKHPVVAIDEKSRNEIKVLGSKEKDTQNDTMKVVTPSELSTVEDKMMGKKMKRAQSMLANLPEKLKCDSVRMEIPLDSQPNESSQEPSMSLNHANAPDTLKQDSAKVDIPLSLQSNKEPSPESSAILNNVCEAEESDITQTVSDAIDNLMTIQKDILSLPIQSPDSSFIPSLPVPQPLLPPKYNLKPVFVTTSNSAKVKKKPCQAVKPNTPFIKDADIDHAHAQTPKEQMRIIPLEVNAVCKPSDPRKGRNSSSNQNKGVNLGVIKSRDPRMRHKWAGSDDRKRTTSSGSESLASPHKARDQNQALNVALNLMKSEEPVSTNSHSQPPTSGLPQAPLEAQFTQPPPTFDNAMYTAPPPPLPSPVPSNPAPVPSNDSNIEELAMMMQLLTDPRFFPDSVFLGQGPSPDLAQEAMLMLSQGFKPDISLRRLISDQRNALPDDICSTVFKSKSPIGARSGLCNIKAKIDTNENVKSPVKQRAGKGRNRPKHKNVDPSTYMSEKLAESSPVLADPSDTQDSTLWNFAASDKQVAHSSHMSPRGSQRGNRSGNESLNESFTYDDIPHSSFSDGVKSPTFVNFIEQLDFSALFSSPKKKPIRTSIESSEKEPIENAVVHAEKIQMETDVINIEEKSTQEIVHKSPAVTLQRVISTEVVLDNATDSLDHEPPMSLGIPVPAHREESTFDIHKELHVSDDESDESSINTSFISKEIDNPKIGQFKIASTSKETVSPILKANTEISGGNQSKEKVTTNTDSCGKASATDSVSDMSVHRRRWDMRTPVVYDEQNSNLLICYSASGSTVRDTDSDVGSSSTNVSSMGDKTAPIMSSPQNLDKTTGAAQHVEADKDNESYIDSSDATQETVISAETRIKTNTETIAKSGVAEINISNISESSSIAKRNRQLSGTSLHDNASRDVLGDASRDTMSLSTSPLKSFKSRLSPKVLQSSVYSPVHCGPEDSVVVKDTEGLETVASDVIGGEQGGGVCREEEQKLTGSADLSAQEDKNVIKTTDEPIDDDVTKSTANENTPEPDASENQEPEVESAVSLLPAHEDDTFDCHDVFQSPEVDDKRKRVKSNIEAYFSPEKSSFGSRRNQSRSERTGKTRKSFNDRQEPVRSSPRKHRRSLALESREKTRKHQDKIVKKDSGNKIEELSKPKTRLSSSGKAKSKTNKNHAKKTLGYQDRSKSNSTSSLKDSDDVFDTVDEYVASSISEDDRTRETPDRKNESVHIAIKKDDQSLFQDESALDFNDGPALSEPILGEIGGVSMKLEAESLEEGELSDSTMNETLQHTGEELKPEPTKETEHSSNDLRLKLKSALSDKAEKAESPTRERKETRINPDFDGKKHSENPEKPGKSHTVSRSRHKSRSPEQRTSSSNRKLSTRSRSKSRTPERRTQSSRRQMNSRSRSKSRSAERRIKSSKQNISRSRTKSSSQERHTESSRQQMPMRSRTKSRSRERRTGKSSRHEISRSRTKSRSPRPSSKSHSPRSHPKYRSPRPRSKSRSPRPRSRDSPRLGPRSYSPRPRSRSCSPEYERRLDKYDKNKTIRRHSLRSANDWDSGREYSRRPNEKSARNERYDIEIKNKEKSRDPLSSRYHDSRDRKVEKKTDSYESPSRKSSRYYDEEREKESNASQRYERRLTRENRGSLDEVYDSKKDRNPLPEERSTSTRDEVRSTRDKLYESNRERVRSEKERKREQELDLKKDYRKSSARLTAKRQESKSSKRKRSPSYDRSVRNKR